MKRSSILKLTALAAGLSALLGAGTASAQAHAPLKYYGGPILSTFKMYPLYYGTWTQADINTQQNYLTGLAAYLSGSGAPAGQQPMMKQYGVLAASVAPAATAGAGATPTSLTEAQVRTIIHNAQAAGTLHAYDRNSLILVFLAPGFLTHVTCGYHGFEDTSSFYGVVPMSCGPQPDLVGHEVFEAATDPADGQGWEEAVDGCTTSIPLSFGNIPGAADNMNGGACSTTGYTPIVPPGQKFGYLWADQASTASYTPSTVYQYNSTGATNTAVRTAVGAYTLTFPNLGDPGGTVDVTAYGLDAATCKAESWIQSGGNELVHVRCFTAAGAAVDSRFTALFAVGAGESDLAYAWADSPGVASYSPNAAFAFNPYTAALPTITRSNPGTYSVRFPGMMRFGPTDPRGGGDVKVTAYGTGTEACKPANWIYSTGDLLVNVLCTTPAGAAVDTKFAVSFQRKTDLFGRFFTQRAHAWAGQASTPSYTPSLFYQWNSAGNDLTITRSAVGTYAVRIPGQSRIGGNVQVSAYGTGAERCKVQSWAPSGSDQLVNVLCYSTTGAAADAMFDVSYVYP